MSNEVNPAAYVPTSGDVQFVMNSVRVDDVTRGDVRQAVQIFGGPVMTLSDARECARRAEQIRLVAKAAR